MKLDILYEDKDIIICNKPSGRLVQSDRSFEKDMVSELLTLFKARGEQIFCAPINRLDKPVEGIVIFAKNSKMAGLLSNVSYEKYYYALATGRIEQPKGTYTDYLVKDGKNNISKVVGSEVKGSKLAKLDYEVVSYKRYGDLDYSLVRIRLLTGRHHQIRVQFSSRQHSLYGDRKYNNIPPLAAEDNIALCAYSIRLIHPISKKEINLMIKPSSKYLQE